MLVLSGFFSGSTVGWAQASYFNVPGSDVAETYKINIPQRFTIQDYYRSLTTFDYGLGRKWKIGANLLNLDYYPHIRHVLRNDSTSERAYSLLLTLNAQNIFNLQPEEPTRGMSGILVAGSKLGFRLVLRRGYAMKNFTCSATGFQSARCWPVGFSFDVYLSKNLPLAVGWQCNNQEGTSALVIQLTYSPD